VNAGARDMLGGNGMLLENHVIRQTTGGLEPSAKRQFRGGLCPHLGTPPHSTSLTGEIGAGQGAGTPH
jgi:hypothetical protein